MHNAEKKYVSRDDAQHMCVSLSAVTTAMIINSRVEKIVDIAAVDGGGYAHAGGMLACAKQKRFFKFVCISNQG